MDIISVTLCHMGIIDAIQSLCEGMMISTGVISRDHWQVI